MPIEAEDGHVRRSLEMLSRHLVRGGEFSQNSHPSDQNLEDAIAETEGEIKQWLSSAGYTTDPAGWSDDAKRYLAWYNALGAAYRVEQSHTGVSYSRSPSTRAENYWMQYLSLKNDLMSGKLDLTGIGLPLAVGANVQGSVTGVSVSDKETLRSDSDAVQPSFRRTIFRNPERQEPA